MHLKKLLKDKKGAALEMAIIFMVTIFCFCLLVTTMTLTSRSRVKLEKAFLNIDLNTDKVVEGYLLYLDDFNQKVLINGAAWDTDKTSVKISDNQLRDQCSFIASGAQTFFQIITPVEGEEPIVEKFDTFESYIVGKDMYANYTVEEEKFEYNLATPDQITCTVTLKKNDATKIIISVVFLRQHNPLTDVDGNILADSYKVEKKILILNKSA